MKKIEQWIQDHLVPVINKITENFWFSIVADSILYIVPFSMVSAIPNIWGIFRRFFPQLVDLTPISTYSFGLIGIFVSFVIPFNAMEKLGEKGKGTIAGFTGIGTFLLSMNLVENPNTGLASINLKYLGATGMFTAIVLGLLVAFIYKSFMKLDFFGEDSMLPDFVKNWFNNILAILVSLLIGWIVVYVMKINVFTFVTMLMSPVTGFAQTIYGVLFITLLQNVFYFFGVSAWIFTPVTRTITQAAVAENAAMIAAGNSPSNIYSFGFGRYSQIGGSGSTLALSLMMLFSKSRKNKVLGKATLIPSLFNINEPIFYGTVVGNPYYFVPIILMSIIPTTISYIAMTLGWASINHVMFDMFFVPNIVQVFVMSGGDWRNVVLVIINFAISILIWYPFFKVYDKAQYEKEQTKLANK